MRFCIPKEREREIEISTSDKSVALLRGKLS